MIIKLGLSVSIGIVGHAADKFTPLMEERAKEIILEIITALLISEEDISLTVISGGCHLGGIDKWAEEVANYIGIPVTVHAPRVLSWSALGGYRDRNLKIAKESDIVHCIVAEEYHSGYTGMRFAKCYHCGSRNPPHIKSGGCWTAWKAKKRQYVTL